MFNLVLVTVLLGPVTRAYPTDNAPARPPVSITSAVLGTFKSLAECQTHIAAPLGGESALDASTQPTLKQTTYCAGR